MDSSRTDLFLMWLCTGGFCTNNNKETQTKIEKSKTGKRIKKNQHNKITLLYAKKIMFGWNLTQLAASPTLHSTVIIRETKIWQKIWWNKQCVNGMVLVQGIWGGGITTSTLLPKMSRSCVLYLKLTSHINRHLKKSNDWNLIPGRDHQPSFSFAYSSLFRIENAVSKLHVHNLKVDKTARTITRPKISISFNITLLSLKKSNHQPRNYWRLSRCGLSPFSHDHYDA